MNIAFFLIPKSHVALLVEGSSFRQGMEKLHRHGYTAIPVISKEGHYLGSISEGDFLWNIMSMGSIDSHDLEQAQIDDIISDRTPPVRVTTSVEDLISRAMEQNFVPVVDDRDMFMGIVTRRAILSYYAKHDIPLPQEAVEQDGDDPDGNDRDREEEPMFPFEVSETASSGFEV